MANVLAASKKKRLFAIALAVCLCAALVAAPAYAFWYVHGEEHVADTSDTGVIEILYTVDATAIGGGVTAGQTFVHQNSTAADLLEEVILSSESQNGLEAIHDYGYSSLAEYLADQSYEVTVYSADSQEAGTHTTYDGDALTGEDVALERYDSVVFTLS